MLNFGQALAVILTACICTFFLRVVPFALFSKKEVPPAIRYLGLTLPPTVMAILVVFSLKSTTFSSPAGFLPQFISVAVVVLLHLWKRQTLLSIIGGTLCYMILVQAVFV